VEVVNDFSLLMTLQGSDAELDPAMVPTNHKVYEP